MANESNQAKSIFLAALDKHAPEHWPAFLDEACAGDVQLRAELEKLLRARSDMGSFHEAPQDGEKQRPGAMAIFDKALDIASPEEREAYLAAACAGQPELRQQVDAFLQAYENASCQVSTVDTPILEGPGTVIGPYKLLEQIGEGGFGVVFMAEQKEPIRRKVALKVVKPGMDTKEVIARFEAERQALALMDHVNIAKVLDAGQTTSGRPYFVMDLVKGVPITKFCDESQLTLKERLELFMHVCKAVQHAHQKGIIHRDIKPSNVLVTMQDGASLVKVIDFGIAKALGQQLTDRTFFTGFAQMIGTPLYMSPEQAALSNVDVDTRSDIYSLGVLLYELLTGTTPIDRKRLHEAAYDEIRRIIREEEPPTPSTRMSTLGQEASVVSAQRKSDARRLSKLFRGELDWIVMKALDKDRNRRFETANGLAEDIQRYLVDEPVLAGPPTARYRLRKFVRRHRRALLVAVVVMSALVVVLTTVAGSIGWVIGERSAREAEITRRVRDAITLARSLVADNQPAQARQRLIVAQGLIAKDRETLPRLAAELDVFVENLDRFGRFIKLIDQAHEAEATYLGYSPQRGTLLIKALARYKVLEREDWCTVLEQSALVKQQVKQIRRTVYEELLWLANHAVSWWHDPRSQEGPGPSGVVELDPEAAGAFVGRRRESAARGALAYLRSAEKAYPPTHWFYQLRANCHNTLGREEEARKDQELASKTPSTMVIDYFFEAQAAVQKFNLPDAVRALEAGLRLEPTHFWSLLLLGTCLMDQGQREPERVEAAVSTFTGCIMKQPMYAQTWFDRGLANKMLGRSEAAAKDFAKARELKPNYEQTFIVQGDAYSELRQWDKAISEYSKAMENTSSKLGLPERARIHINLGQWDQAIADYSEALERFSDWRAINAINALAVIYSKLGQSEKAIADCSKVIDRRPQNGRAWEMRGELYGKMGQWDKALENHSQAVKLDGNSKFKRASAWNNRGLAYLKLAKRDQALADFSKAIELDKDIGLIWSSQGYYDDHRLGLFEKAHDEFEKAIDLQPDNAKYPNALAWLLVAHADPKIRDPRRAVALAKKAVTLQDKDGNYWNTLGAAHYRAGDWQAALQALDKSIEVKTWHDPGGYSYQWFFLAMAHWQLGHRDEARKAYDRAVTWMKNLPNNPGLNWVPAKGPDTDELRRFRAEAANLLGIQD